MSADLILFNGQFHTVDREKPLASAVAIKDGRFVAVGNDAEAMALKGSATQVVDMKGRCVIPGLNDPDPGDLRRSPLPPTDRRRRAGAIGLLAYSLCAAGGVAGRASAMECG